jgi:hypothetical protein
VNGCVRVTPTKHRSSTHLEIPMRLRRGEDHATFPRVDSSYWGFGFGGGEVRRKSEMKNQVVAKPGVVRAYAGVPPSRWVAD